MRPGRFALIALSVAAAFATAPAAAQTTHQVTINGLNFSPRNLQIQVGDTVTWTNNTGVPHNVREDGDAFRCAQGCDDSGGNGAPTGQWTVSRTFNSVAMINYYCEVHGSLGGLGMSGTITVGGGGPGGGGNALFADDFETGDYCSWSGRRGLAPCAASAGEIDASGAVVIGDEEFRTAAGIHRGRIEAGHHGEIGIELQRRVRGEWTTEVAASAGEEVEFTGPAGTYRWVATGTVGAFYRAAFSHPTAGRAAGAAVDMRVTPAAARGASEFGLEALYDGSPGVAHLIDGSPRRERGYEVTFFMRLAPGFTLAEGERVEVFAGVQRRRKKVLRFVVEGTPAANRFLVRLEALETGNVWREVASLTSRRRWTRYKIDWMQETAPGARDGMASLGKGRRGRVLPRNRVMDLGSSFRIDNAFFGVVTSSAGASGSVFFDDYESERKR